MVRGKKATQIIVIKLKVMAISMVLFFFVSHSTFHFYSTNLYRPCLHALCICMLLLAMNSLDLSIQYLITIHFRFLSHCQWLLTWMCLFLNALMLPYSQLFYMHSSPCIIKTSLAQNTTTKNIQWLALKNVPKQCCTQWYDAMKTFVSALF